MLDKIKSYRVGLNKTFVLNAISIILLQGISFLTMPIFSRVLGSSQYGLYAVFTSWVSIFSTFLSLDIPESFISGRFKFNNDYNNYRYNILFFTILVSTFNSIILVLLYTFIKKFIDYSFILFILLILTALSTIIINSVFIILQLEKKVLPKLIISIFLSVSTAVLSLILILNFKFSELYIGRVIGHFIPYFVVALFIIIYYIIVKEYIISIEYLKFGLLFGLPLIGHTLAGSLLAQSDRIMMSKMNILSSHIGIYSLYFSFTSVVGIILNSFNLSFAPFYSDYIHNDDKDSLVKKSKNYIELFTVLCIGFLLLSREVSYIVANEGYYYGINLIPIFVTMKYFIFMYHFPVNYEFYFGKTKYIAIGTLSATILNICLNFILIQKIGMYGAALATLFAGIIEFAFHYIIALSIKEKEYYITLKYFIIPFLLYLVFVFAFYALKDYVLVRWFIGALIGVYEIARIIKRKYIF